MKESNTCACVKKDMERRVCRIHETEKEKDRKKEDRENAKE